MIPLLMTRPMARSERFVAGLPKGLRKVVEPHYAPMWRMEGGTPAPDFDSAIITSANGVHFGPDARGRPAFCIGTVTTAKARQAGWDARQVGEDADTLVDALRTLRPEGKLMHLSGARTRGEVAERLRAAGLDTHRHVTYVQHPLPLDDAAKALLASGPVLVPLFSPDGAAHFADEAAGASQVHAAAISRATADGLGNFAPSRLVVAQSPDAQSLGSALYSLAQDLLAG